MKTGTKWKQVNPADIPEHLQDKLRRSQEFFKHARDLCTQIASDMHSIHPEFMFNMANGILLCAPSSTKSNKPEYVSLVSQRNETLIEVTPPNDVLVSNKSLKRFYMTTAGYLPANWRQHPTVTVKRYDNDTPKTPRRRPRVQSIS